MATAGFSSSRRVDPSGTSEHARAGRELVDRWAIAALMNSQRLKATESEQPNSSVSYRTPLPAAHYNLLARHLQVNRKGTHGRAPPRRCGVGAPSANMHENSVERDDPVVRSIDRSIRRAMPPAESDSIHGGAWPWPWRERDSYGFWVGGWRWRGGLVRGSPARVCGEASAALSLCFAFAFPSVIRGARRAPPPPPHDQDSADLGAGRACATGFVVVLVLTHVW
jgi:hypothetical protein